MKTTRHTALSTLFAAVAALSIAPAAFADGAEYDYPPARITFEKTTAQVQAELAAAQRNGDIVVNAESGQRAFEVYAGRYPSHAVGVAKTRQEVKAELAEAIRTGNIVGNGETGLKLNELAPQRYAPRASSRGTSPLAAASVGADVN
jgi:Domain of unknown function (DUF4148)